MKKQKTVELQVNPTVLLLGGHSKKWTALCIKSKQEIRKKFEPLNMETKKNYEPRSRHRPRANSPTCNSPTRTWTPYVDGIVSVEALPLVVDSRDKENYRKQKGGNA